MKENIQNIQTGLLVVIALTVIYGTFLKDSSSTPTQRERVTRQRANRQSNVAATPPANNINQPKPPTNQGPVNSPTKIVFDQMAYDFGDIDQNSENKMAFTFTNTGDKPLILESVTGSCGCTVPEYPKEPIMPGESSEIKVVYKPGKQKGMQNKLVTVIANTQPKDTRLNITANVHEVK
jgi:hypothetical protein